MEHEAREEYERIQEEEELYDARRWESFVEARLDDAASSSESSTVRLDARKWEDVAMKDQLEWQASKRLRGHDDLAVLSSAV